MALSGVPESRFLWLPDTDERIAATVYFAGAGSSPGSASVRIVTLPLAALVRRNR
jgi:hypothetical protein